MRAQSQSELLAVATLLTGMLAALPASADEVDFDGPTDDARPSQSQGALAHDAVPIEVAVPFDTAGQPTRDATGQPAHPFASEFDFIYTQITSVGLYDFGTGEERPTDTLAPPFGASGDARDLDLVPFSGDLHLAFSGFHLDIDSPADFYFEPARAEVGARPDSLYLEHRIYRGGELIVIEDRDGRFVPVARYLNAELHFVIDWQRALLGEPEPISLVAEGLVTPDSEMPLSARFFATSSHPVDQDGATPEAFALYPIIDGVLEVDDDIPMVRVSERLDFGTVAYNQPERSSRYVFNRGNAPLTVHGLRLVRGSGETFRLATTARFPAVLAPDESIEFEVTSPSRLIGAASSTLVVETDDLYFPEVEVRLLAHVDPPRSVPDWIIAIRATIADALARRTLSGTGTGAEPAQRLTQLDSLFILANLRWQAGSHQQACDTLASAALRMDGLAVPVDYISGPATRSVATIVGSAISLCRSLTPPIRRL